MKDVLDLAGLPGRLGEVVASAARLHEVVPDAVLVGGSAAALYARHQESFDHDHVLADLAANYAVVLEAVESTDGWATSVRASSPPMTLLGSLGGIEAGLRQLRRTRPLETVSIEVPPVGPLRIPTWEETLRVKAYLVVQRNQVRDYLDVVALADANDAAAGVLTRIDDYYSDRSQVADSVVTAVIQRLSEPNPKDVQVTSQLVSYKGLITKWQDWDAVVDACGSLALKIITEST